ncbi:MAG: DUF2207 domain-containing protein [Chloroflexi bacterium]|nr:DUF2207 domain-containing protein [Chloroflexota bacterium]
MKRFVFLLLAIFCAFILAPTVSAQARSVLVERRDGDITIFPNGDVRVVETWQVKFSGTPAFTNASRTLPLGAVREFVEWGVSEGGQEYKSATDRAPRTFTVTDEANAKKLTWYFPETTNATRTFVLRYTARGILRASATGEQFNWTFIEAGRGYTINASRVVVHLPKTFAANEIKTSANGQVMDGQTVEYTGGAFVANASWTINVEYPRTTANLATLVPPTPTREPTVVTLLRRDADISIRADGETQFVETWQMQVKGGPINKASRAFALARVDDLTQMRVSEANVEYAEQQTGVAQTYSVQRAASGTLITLTWYFQPTTNATRTFTLRYTARGAIRQTANVDEFYWTFVEADRDYAITNARVLVHLPASFETSRITPFENARVMDGKTIEFTRANIAANDAWSVRAQFPHGALNASAPKWQVIEEQQPIYNLIALVAAILVLLGGALGFYVLWFLRGRDRARGIIAEFYTTPPDNIPPGMAGALIDERVDQQDLVATLVDLARRGFVRISELTAGAPSYNRVSADTSGLRVYEKTLLEKIFKPGDQVYVPGLRYEFNRARAALQEVVYFEMVGAGWFTAHPGRTRATFATIGCAATLLIGVCGFFAYAFVAEYAPLAICVWLALLTLAFAPLVTSPFMPKRTAQGATLAAKVRAFKRYLERIEKYTKVEEAKDQFEKYLPYAIAFGLEKSWVQKFAAVDTPAPEWYEPPMPVVIPAFDSARDELPARSSSAGGGKSASRESPLDSATRGAFGGLNAMSAGLFMMLDTTASAFSGSEPPRESAPSGGGSSSFGFDSGSSSDSSSSWSSSDSSSSSSDSSSSSSDTGGGGSSDFG